MNAPFRNNGALLIEALSAGLLPQTKPEFVKDVLAMKRHRGDADCDQFKMVAMEFQNRLYADIRGAAYTIRFLLSKAEKAGQSTHWIKTRSAFLADLDRVLSGDLTGWRAA